MPFDFGEYGFAPLCAEAFAAAARNATDALERAMRAESRADAAEARMCAMEAKLARFEMLEEKLAKLAAQQ